MLFHLKSVLTRKSEIPKKIPIFRTVFWHFHYWVHPIRGVKLYIFGLSGSIHVQKYQIFYCRFNLLFKSTVILLCCILSLYSCTHCGKTSFLVSNPNLICNCKSLKILYSTHFSVSSKKSNFEISLNFKLFMKYFTFITSNILNQFSISSL